MRLKSSVQGKLERADLLQISGLEMDLDKQSRHVGTAEQQLTYPHGVRLAYSERVCQFHLDLSTVERAVHPNDLQQTIIMPTGAEGKHGLCEAKKENQPREDNYVLAEADTQLVKHSY